MTDRIEETLARCAAMDNPAFETFARTLFLNAAPQDVADYAPGELAALAKLVFAKARGVKPEDAFVEVFEPCAETTDYRHKDAVLIAVNGDQPFLFDSALGETEAQNARLIAAFHPIVELSRRKVSVIVLILEPLPGTQRKKTLRDGVAAAIFQARAAVRDWPPMRERLHEAIDWLRRAPLRAAFEETRESIAFLEWLYEHFTFLGCCDYAHTSVDGGRLEAMTGSGLGLLAGTADTLHDGVAHLSRPEPVTIIKTAKKSLVHRRVHMDAVGIKFFDEDGAPKGERLFVGLFAAEAYSMRPQDIPLVRRKADAVLRRAALPDGSHDAKALAQIIDAFPRDELFQADADTLFETAMGILHLGERPLVRVFLRFDVLDRFVTAIVYLPRDRYSTEIRAKVHAILAARFGGQMAAAQPTLNETALARIVYTILRDAGPSHAVDTAALEVEIRRVIRTWEDGFAEAMHARFGAAREYDSEAQGFPLRYRDAFAPHEAVEDLYRLETLARDRAAEIHIAPHIWRKADDGAKTLRLKIYGLGNTLPLSQTLPIFENLGLKAIAENAYAVELRGRTAARAAFVLDFRMETPTPLSLAVVKAPIEEAFSAILTGAAENDGFNALVATAGLSWREAAVLRAIAKYLRQAAIPFSQAYMELTLKRNPQIARMLIEMFLARADPATAPEAEHDVAQRIENAVAKVPNLDDDRIIRRFRGVVANILRTNYFQRTAAGAPKPYLSFKLDSPKLDGLPPPKPMAEIFVYAPEVEGIHLRFGKVARGGLRWSDRPEDFRTEILGLVKAQQVKNAVIVPVGAKGGFYPKRLPDGGTREDVQAAGIAAYRTFVGALLELTDTVADDGQVVPPANTTRHDGDDPYLVVAADKGTASFSDIANALALERGFWLGDAFASGGSHGYDHKKMAITARGAWEAVKRHFREMGRDIQTEPFTAVGVGDMSGDVFGNAMLLSKCTKLVAAFDHRHIFIDPDPDPALAWRERKRLFGLPRSCWADYAPQKISAGGGVFARTAKTITLTPEIQALTGLSATQAMPNDVIKALLQAKVDLLFFGGIGTFVKASDQSHDQAGDRVNDPVRIDALAVRAKVVGEGANLGLTQRGRIQAALNGVRLNTDAIDNSAGVDTSDHEVNLKILFGGPLRRGTLSHAARDRLLAAMTDEVARQVLKDNIDQTLALSVAEKRSPVDLDASARFMRDLESRGNLDRGVEALPDDAEIARRAHRGQGLTRPELAVLLAYAKLDLKNRIEPTPLPDDPYLAAEVAAYFPRQAAEDFADEMPRHRLAREIVTDRIVNRIVNLVGPLFVFRLMEVSGVTPQRAVRAILTAEAAFGLDALKDRIDALNTPAAAAAQTAMLEAIGKAMHRLSLWFVVNVPDGAGLAETVDMYRQGVEILHPTVRRLVSPAEAADAETRRKAFLAAAAPDDLAAAVGELPLMAAIPEIELISRLHSQDRTQAAGAFFAVGRTIGLDRLRVAAQGYRGADHWEKLAIRRLIDDLFVRQRQLAQAALTAYPAGKSPADGEAAVAKWAEARAESVARIKELLESFERAGALSVAKLALAVSRIGELA